MHDITRNTDAEEVDKFEQLSEDWWDPNGSLRTLHVINPVRLQYIDDARSLQDCRVLDVGCGGGLLSEAMARRGARVTGIDASDGAIRTATAHAAEQALEINYQAVTAEEFAETGKEQFDIITCMELLEHVPDPHSLLSACTRMLKPGGDLFLATLNRNIRAYLGAVIAAEYLLRLLPRGTHDYGKFLKPSELAHSLRMLGLEVVDISGMHYVPGADRCFINDDPSINYLLHASKGTGE